MKATCTCFFFLFHVLVLYFKSGRAEYGLCSVFKNLKLYKFSFNSLNVATSQLYISYMLCMQRDDDIARLIF